MKSIRLISLFLLSAGIIAITGCGGGGGGGSEGRQCVINLYGSQSSSGLSIQADVSFDSSAAIVPLDIYINGNKITTTNSNANWVGYSYELAGTFVPGDLVHVKISRDSWGEVEYDMQVCGYVDDSYIDSITFTPGIDTVLKNIDEGKNDNTKIEAVLPGTEITGCNSIIAWMMSLNYGTAEAVRTGNTLSFNMAEDNSRWLQVRNQIIEKRRGGSLLFTFRWYGEYKIGTKADIYSYYIGRQTGVDFSLPKKVEGTYSLTYDITAKSGSYTKIFSDSIFTVTTWNVNRNFKTLTIVEVPSAAGDADSLKMTITGSDLVVGDEAGCTQTFTSTSISTDGIITGSISGYVYAEFVTGLDAVYSTISSGSFTLTPVGK